MRVAQIIDGLHWGGAQELQVTLAQAARNTDLHVTVISLRHDPGTPYAERLQTAGVQVVTFAAHKLLDAGRLQDVIQFLRNGAFDLLHTHLSSANILGGLAGRWLNIPVIASLHLSARESGRARRRLETWCLRYGTDAVIAVGESVARAHANWLKRDIAIVPNPVCVVPQVAMESNNIRSQLGLSQDVPVLVTVGRLSPEKGYRELLRALDIVKLKHPEIHLLIAGTGAMQAELKQIITSLHLEHNVVLLGARTDVHAILSAADIYVSASLSEGRPLSLLEAMASALPIIATAVGDTPALVPEAAGRIVAPSDSTHLASAILSLLEHPDRWRQMGMIARRHVEAHCNPNDWFRKIRELYLQVLDSRLTASQTALA